MDLQLPSLEFQIMQPFLCFLGILLFGEFDTPFVVLAMLRLLILHVRRHLLAELLMGHAGSDIADDQFVAFVACGILEHVQGAGIVA